jgi:EAL domain-containing protein (putative c-di-GMP-specific phosphodiesterase class I)
VPPDEFIPLAEDSGAISQIGRWVLEQSVAQMARWQQQGRYLPQLFGNAVAAGPLPAAAVRQRRGRPVHRRPPAQTDPL